MQLKYKLILLIGHLTGTSSYGENVFAKPFCREYCPFRNENCYFPFAKVRAIIVASMKLSETLAM